MTTRASTILTTAALTLCTLAGCATATPPQAPTAPTAAVEVATATPEATPEEVVPEIPQPVEADFSVETEFGNKDPFNSEHVDKNKEGKLIMEKALEPPQPDPPTP